MVRENDSACPDREMDIGLETDDRDCAASEVSEEEAETEKNYYPVYWDPESSVVLPLDVYANGARLLSV